MPPKQRITREMILEESFAMFKREGMDAVNARSVAKALGCSTQPIFSYFAGMEDLKSALKECAMECFGMHMENMVREDFSIEGVCKAYVRFAKEQPRVFLYLFMQNGSVAQQTETIERLKSQLNALPDRSAALSREELKELGLALWTYAHGLATACVAGVALTDEEVSAAINKRVKAEILRLEEQDS